MKILFRAAASVAVAVQLFMPMALGSAIAAPNPSLGSGFSGVPGAKAGGADLGRSRFTYQLDPSQSASDQFYVQNTGSTPLDLKVYSQDAYTDTQGLYNIKATNDVATDVGSWISFAGGKKQAILQLKPGEDASVPFSLVVPSFASPGDHLGAIVVSTIAAPSDGQIVLERRVATRLYARIRGPLSPLLSVSNISATYIPSFNPFEGTIIEKFTVTNVGNVSLSAKAFASVAGPFGIPLAANRTYNVEEVSPGAHRDFELSMVGVGQWVFLHPNVNLVTYVDKDALNAGRLPVVSRDVIIWVFPTTFFIILVLVLIVALVIRGTVRNRQRQVKRWLAYTEAEARRNAGLN